MTWVLAQTKTNAAQIACRNLQRQGFETFLPLEKATQNRRGKISSVLRPYFGNYIFVRAGHASAPISAISSTLAIQKLVRFGETIAEVPAGLITELLYACDDQGCLSLSPNLSEGDKVRVTTGPFKDQLGAVEALSTGERVWVLMELMGQKTKTLMSAKGLSRVA